MADDHRIFVGDLGNEVNDETLSMAFRNFKSFQKSKVIREKWNNKTKGYGFVSFSDSADMVACMKTMNGALRAA
jgi:RNA recognition motif-containing protein